MIRFASPSRVVAAVGGVLGFLLLGPGGREACAHGFMSSARDARSITLPLRFERGIPVILARIDGHELPMIVDVAQIAPLTLFPEAADALKPAETGRHLSFTDFEGSVADLPIFEVQHLEFGGITFRKVSGYVMVGESTAAAGGSAPQGVIGLGALRSFKVILDYRRKLMTLIPAGSDGGGAECRGTAVPFLPDWNGVPVAAASTDVGDVVFVWETRVELSMLRGRFAQDANVTVTHGSVSLQHLEFGGHDFGATLLPTLDYEGSIGTDGFIGNDFVARHVVCFDFPARRLLIHD